MLDQQQAPNTQKYRLEQMVRTFIDGVPTNHVETKYEYTLSTEHDEEGLIVRIHADSHWAKSHPDQYQSAIDMVNDLDLLKSHVVIRPDAHSGKMATIVNHAEIVQAWGYYKKVFMERYDFVRSEETRQAVAEFLAIAEGVIMDEGRLIEDLHSKPFFYLIFDGYLVGQDVKEARYAQTYQSQLFPGLALNLDMDQSIVQEAPDWVLLRKKSQMPALMPQQLAQLQQQYDERYWPMIHRPFSQYAVTHETHLRLGPDDRTLAEAEFSILEEVAHNIELDIHCKLRSIG